VQLQWCVSMNVTFNEIYNQFYKKVRRYLVRLVGDDIAEDLTQEVFIKINKGLPDFEGKSKISTWVYRIATNTALDRLRSGHCSHEHNPTREAEKKDQGAGELDAISDKKSSDMDDQLIKAEMRQCISEFVDRLPPDHRTVVVLSEIKELKNREIAEILGVSLATVKIRLHRARERLQKEFEAGCDFYVDADSELSCDRKT